MNKQIEWCQDYIQRNLSKMRIIRNERRKELLKLSNGDYFALNKYSKIYDSMIQEDFLNNLKISKIDNNTLIRIGKSFYEIISLVEESNYFMPPKKANVKLYRVRKMGYYKYKENIGYTHYLHLYVYDDLHKVILEKN